LKFELWIGDPARIKLAQVRKQNIAENDTVIVDDVNSDPRYLACSLSAEPVFIPIASLVICFERPTAIASRWRTSKPAA
jgi:putative methionine-R-sulfoxide reductase with GAF domain